MKLRVLSDLHLEFTGYAPQQLRPAGEDVVVLAGDIGLGVDGIRWAQHAFGDRPVLYVLGNHEFYGFDFDRLVEDARESCRGSSVRVLEHERVDLGGFRFLGCALWTDLQVFGGEMRKAAAAAVESQLTDYRLIRRGPRRLRAADTESMCRSSRTWLAREIAASPLPVVVVTHHVPTLATRHPDFDSLTDAAFHNAFDDLIRPPVRLWIHGHTHHSAQVAVNGVPVVSNQRGYPGEKTRFDWNALFELEARDP